MPTRALEIGLCWWHLRRALCTRLAMVKLSMTPYNVKRAYEEFLIDPDSIPPGRRVNATDYEGGSQEDANPGSSHSDSAPTITIAADAFGKITNSLCIRISMATQQTAARATTKESQSADKENNVAMGNIRAEFTLHFNTNPLITTPSETDKTAENQEEISDDEDGEIKSRRTFCYIEYCEAIVNMMEPRYCVHPTIPGYAAPDPRSIKRWGSLANGVFGIKHELPVVWAFFCENRKG